MPSSAFSLGVLYLAFPRATSEGFVFGSRTYQNKKNLCHSLIKQLHKTLSYVKFYPKSQLFCFIVKIKDGFCNRATVEVKSYFSANVIFCNEEE